MKNLFFYTLLIGLFSIILNAQESERKQSLDAMMTSHGGKIFRNSKNKETKILGTPYFQQMFALAKVDNVTQKYFMRYNVFADEFEFITPKNDTLILDKIADFNKITFSGINKKYSLLEYTNSGGNYVKGYLIEFYTKGNYTLYVKEKVTYYSGKVAKTSLEKDMPERYVKAENGYYFKNKEAVIIEFPESKKQLIKLYPDKKQEIETFIKDTKVSFNEDYDRIKIIDFLSAL